MSDGLVSGQRRMGLASSVAAGARWRGLLAAGVVIAAAMVADPFCGIPYGDDFSYAKTALEFARTGHLVYNGWASMLLGWQAVWGACFVKLFGFSFDVLRVSVMLLGGGCIYLFHQILVSFGVRRRDALLGALTLGLTPLFQPLATSFMSDIPGLLSVLLCARMCQKAITAETDRGAVAWLVAAAAGNVVSGSVRQICWLGVLLMVPSTAWLLRRRRGVVAATAICWCVSVVLVLLSVRWLNRQPWALPEHIVQGRITLFRVGHLAAQVVKASLVLLLLTAPATSAFLQLRRGSRRGWVVLLAASFGIPAAMLLALPRPETLGSWLMPWLDPILKVELVVLEPVVFSTGCRAVVTVLAAGAGLFAAGQAFRLRRERRGGEDEVSRTFWHLFGPFSAGVIVLIAPRGMFYLIQDRYLLLLLPPMLLGLLLGYEDLAAKALPALSWGVLALFAAYSTAALHDRQASARSDVELVRRLEKAGIPRSAVSAGFPGDSWYEVSVAGHVNNLLFVGSSLGSYQPNVAKWDVPEGCEPPTWELYPSIHPRYFLAASLDGRCFVPTAFEPIAFRAWLPPFRRERFVVQAATPDPARE